MRDGDFAISIGRVFGQDVGAVEVLCHYAQESGAGCSFHLDNTFCRSGIS